jgi:GT2 family glycosyltransferase
MRDHPGTRIAVVIVSWNGRDHLIPCLRALEAQTDRNFGTVVVDNGSSDDTLAMLGRDFPWVRTVVAGANVGFAEGTNLGIAASQSDWVATLNNDTVAHPTWIAALRAQAVRCEDRVGMLQSRLVLSGEPRRLHSTGVILFANGAAADRDFGAPVRPDDARDEIFCVCAGAALYRRTMLEQLRLESGVFDRRFFMYFEDVDLGWRARLGGWSAWYVPDAVVVHEHEGSSRRHGPDFALAHARRNRLRMIVKNGSWRLLARGAPLTLIDLATALCRSGPGELAGFARAARDGWRDRAAVTRLMRIDRRRVEKRWQRGI